VDVQQLHGLLRRIRRLADMSQRDLARAADVTSAALGRAEAGGDLRVSQLLRIVAVAGLRLTLVDRQGGELAPMTGTAVRDRGGRLFPAHLDTRHGDEDWWHDAHRYSRRRPEYTFDRDRERRDGRRSRSAAVPADHHVPQPGDSLADRAVARREEAIDRQRARRAAGHRAWVEGGGLLVPDWGTGCTCPAGCEYDEERNPDMAHVPDCACRCDLD
jgi:transcriptional regulator with XRE-family HTH domain